MNPSQSPARVRFAPSPTGHLHLGGARTALYDYLLAKQTKGQFILRIEDTDRRRYVEGAEKELIDSLKWLGLSWDEGPDIGGPYGPYRQSEKKDVYLKYAQRLIDSGNAYYCFCTQAELEKVRQEQIKNKENFLYPGTCRNLDPQTVQARIDNGDPHVIRFKSPKEGETVVEDLLRGEIKVANRLLDDYILVKSDGWALYHLAAIVDDYEMKITHVIRGSEWLPTLPLHSLIIRALDMEEPVWVHLSVFLKPSGKGKMSKRDAADLSKDGYSIYAKEMGKLGYLPEAVDNWIALMGWSYDDRTEFFTMADLIEKFTLERLNPSPAAINFTKLDHFNSLHLRELSDRDLADRLLPYFTAAGITADVETLEKLAPVLKPRLVTLDEGPEKAGFFFSDSIEYDPAELIPPDTSLEQAKEIAAKSLTILQDAGTASPEVIEPIFKAYLESSGYAPKQVFGFLRTAVTGQKVTPPLFESMEVIGFETCLQRIKQATETVFAMVTE